MPAVSVEIPVHLAKTLTEWADRKKIGLADLVRSLLLDDALHYMEGKQSGMEEAHKSVDEVLNRQGG